MRASKKEPEKTCRKHGKQESWEKRPPCIYSTARRFFLVLEFIHQSRQDQVYNTPSCPQGTRSAADSPANCRVPFARWQSLHDKGPRKYTVISSLHTVRSALSSPVPGTHPPLPPFTARANLFGVAWPACGKRQGHSTRVGQGQGKKISSGQILVFFPLLFFHTTTKLLSKNPQNFSRRVSSEE